MRREIRPVRRTRLVETSNLVSSDSPAEQHSARTAQGNFYWTRNETSDQNPKNH